jgi:hypothetical protein
MDLVFIAAIVVFGALACAFAAGCAKLEGKQ